MQQKVRTFEINLLFLSLSFPAGHAGKLHPGQVRVLHGQWLPGRVPAGGGSVPHPGRRHVVRHHVGTGHLLQRDPVTRHDGQIAQVSPTNSQFVYQRVRRTMRRMLSKEDTHGQWLRSI